MGQRESRISGDILDAMRAKGWFAFKIQGGPTMMRGLPDIIACVEGLFITVETKVPEKRNNTSAVQKLVHEAIRKAGGEVLVACGAREVVERIEALLAE